MALEWLKVWNGSAWVFMNQAKVWNGSAWVPAHASSHKVWDGSAWQPTQAQEASLTLKWDAAAPTPTGSWTTYTKTFYATWGATYQSDGDKRSETDLYQGYYSSTNGNQKALAGFDFAILPNTSGTVECLSCYVTLKNKHWGSAAGGTAVLGTHNKTSEPATYPGSGVTVSRVTSSMERYQTKKISLGTTIGAEFMNGTSHGVAIGPGDTTALTYYGYFEGSTSSSARPLVEVTYRVFA